MSIIFASDRKFSLFSYDIKHGLLLLRSGKTNDHRTRCDVLFRDVRAIEIRAWSEGIRITEESPDFLDRFASAPIDLFEEGLTVYRIFNDAWSGFVLAAMVTTGEDDAEFFANSALLPPVV